MKEKTKKWSSGIHPQSPMSYEKYMTAGLDIISNRISVRKYKLAPQNEYPCFERGRDLRIVIFWDDKPALDIHGRKYEFLVEQSFWNPSCRNKEDQCWMRIFADIHLKNFHDAVLRGKQNAGINKSKNISNKKKVKLGQTQTLLDNFKKQ